MLKRRWRGEKKLLTRLTFVKFTSNRLKIPVLSTTQALVPLTEAVPPPPTEGTVSHVTATVDQYGAYMKFSDLVTTASIDPILAAFSDQLGYQAGMVIDLLTRAQLIANGTAQYIDGANNTAVGTLESTDVLTFNEILLALTTLKKNDARPFEDGKYKLICHPNVVYDLFQDSVLQPMFIHAPTEERNGLWTGKIGSFLDVDVFQSSNAYRAATGYGSRYVYYNLLLARDAFGTGGMASMMAGKVPETIDEPLTGKKVMPVSLIHHTREEIGGPLNQFETLGGRFLAQDKSSKVGETLAMRQYRAKQEWDA